MNATLDPALAEARRMYFEECSELLTDAAERLAGLAESLDRSDPEDVNAVFRAVHSAKDGGGAWGLKDVASFAHAYEALLGAIRDGAVPVSSEIVDKLVEANDVLTALIQKAEQDEATDPAAWGGLAEALKAATAGVEPGPQRGTTEPPTEPHTDNSGRPTYRLPSTLDNATAPTVRKALLDAMAGAESIEVLGDEVERVTTLGIQVLVAVSKEIAERGGTFALKNPSPPLVDCLTSLGFRDLIVE